MSSNSYFAKKYNVLCENSNFLEKNTITLPCYENIDIFPVINNLKDFLKC